MDFRKRYKLSLFILIPLIITCFTFLTTYLAFTLGQGAKILGSSKNINFFLGAMVAAWGLSFLLVRIILHPIEKYLKKTGKSTQDQERKPVKKIIEEKDEIDRFEEAVLEVMDSLSIAESRELFPEIIGESQAFRTVLKQCRLVAPSDTTVLITGESGTGKELLASAIHRLSDRGKKPFIAINCVAIPEGLLESELFGHERGSFTGAVSQKKGKFEAAHEGTLFLDEIGDMSLATQAKILRALEEREFERVGGNKALRVNVRVIAATNQDLRQKVKEGTFREDLYHRIKVFDIEMLPLRRRREDILLLAYHFLSEVKEGSGKVTPAAEKALMAYDWPGNVRELKNALERAEVLAGSEPIAVEHLPPEIQTLVTLRGGFDVEGPLDDKLAHIEKGLILDALKKTGGVQARAAEILGITQRSLWHRVKKYGISVSDLKLQ